MSLVIKPAIGNVEVLNVTLIHIPFVRTVPVSDSLHEDIRFGLQINNQIWKGKLFSQGIVYADIGF